MQKHYSIFKLELCLENVNPCVYVAYLFMGVFSLSLSLLWLVYFIMNQIVNSGVSSEFLSYGLIALEGSPVSPLAPLFFLLLVYYVNICVISGYMQMSRRVPRCFSLQQIKKDGTYLDSFLIYCMVLLVNALSYQNLYSIMFSQYLRDTDTQKMFSLLDQIGIIKTVFRSKMIGYLFVFVFLLNLMLECCRLKRPKKSQKQIELEMLRRS